MTENPVKKRPHKLSYIALASAIVLVCLLLLNWLIRASSTITSDFTKDMNMISHLKQMQDAGITSLKIEGRMKSAYYVATVVNAYRQALDSKNIFAK